MRGLNLGSQPSHLTITLLPVAFSVEFEEAAQKIGITIEAAPMGLAARAQAPMFDWLPTSSGHRRVTMALREWLARLAGA